MKKFFSSLLFVVAVGTASVTAQSTTMPQQQEKIEVSDAELTQFADVFQKMRMMNQEAQKEMMTVVQEKNFELQRFNEIHQANMDPNKEVETTDAEDKKYKAVVSQLEEMQPELQKKMQEVISESDLSMERYQQLAMALQSDASLQQRLQEIMKS
ncbi:DUF4168 domain-containing protein [Christiangramia forsetii]|uniref:DUF4168 domain-containing protein n=2 Tax=Christiangramia forsetii TaxID=411153 RepID=A0M3I1_CHRFK|nr:DUF4168 domain-containing protein [Christiangramia forsetii]GGG25824.1 hypothetical protein GCM10011532_06450 [Christiangramia forsetii]CAL67176.1 conserved hypothetical protein [Christiangramia forsetii KT0803]